MLLIFGQATRKIEKNREKGEERKKGRRRKEERKKKEASLGVFILRYLVVFVWFLLAILMVEKLDHGMCGIQFF